MPTKQTTPYFPTLFYNTQSRDVKKQSLKNKKTPESNMLDQVQLVRGTLNPDGGKKNFWRTYVPNFTKNWNTYDQRVNLTTSFPIQHLVIIAFNIPHRWSHLSVILAAMYVYITCTIYRVQIHSFIHSKCFILIRVIVDPGPI